MTIRRDGITEKHLKNRRFRKTEEKILKVFFDGGERLDITTMAKRVGVARSTFYQHHRAIYTIVPDYRHYLLGKFRGAMREPLRRQMSVKYLYMKLLGFVMSHRKLFKMVSADDNRQVLKGMVMRLRPRVEAFARLPKNCQKMFVVYVNEVVGLLEQWGEGGYKEQDMDTVLGDIMYLTETARHRLCQLMD